MKLFIISDTHNNIKILKCMLRLDRPDLIIHLGDYVEDGEKIAKALGVPSVIVRGNGDYSSDYLEDELIEINNKKIYLTHGHKYSVNTSLDRLIYRARELKANIILFGHTHIPINVRKEDILIMNPGSPSFPRTNSSIGSFGVLEIGKDVKSKIIEIG